jgi:hypothetical protein
MPYATVSGYGTAIDSKSVAFSSYNKVDPVFMALVDQSDNYFYGYHHTCIYNPKDPDD